MLGVTDEGVEEVDEADRNAADVHDIAGEDEERDGQQNVGIRRGVEVCGDGRHHCGLDGHGGDNAGNAEGYCNGDIEEKQDKEQSKKKQSIHPLLPSLLVSVKSRSVRR